MSFFNTKKLTVIPPPIPPTPPYVPPVVPTPEPGSTPDIPRPTFTGDFDVILYFTTDENNKVNKKLLNPSETFNCSVKNSISVINPIIILSNDYDLSDYNYAYIPQLERYYYITDVTMITGQRYQLTMRCDVLMSNKEQIYKLNGVIAKTQDARYINEDFDDGSFINQRGVRVITKNFAPPSGTHGTIFLDTPCHILITQGYHGTGA